MGQPRGWSRSQSGRDAASARDLSPHPEPWERGWQMQHDPAHRPLDPHDELEQALPQGGDLGDGTHRPSGAVLEGGRRRPASAGSGTGWRKTARSWSDSSPARDAQLLEPVFHVPPLGALLSYIQKVCK